MKRKRIIRKFYTHERFVVKDRRIVCIENDDGTLFYSRYKTNILPEDLPEWYVYGRYYKRFGYLSTKGIKDMVYEPNLWINHFLRDDFLLISYTGKITIINDEVRSRFDKYDGYDYLICGPEILDVLKGAKIYSNYNIEPIIEQIKIKKKILREKHPEEFGEGKWDFDIDSYMNEPLKVYRQKRKVHEFEG